MYYAVDRQGTVVGCLLTTSPQTDDIIGYSGPNTLLVVLDAKGVIVGLELLSSEDTHEHVKLVRAQPKFFQRYLGWKPGAEDPPKVAAVSGATLTSFAIAEAVEKRLAGSAPSLRFPDPVTLEEVRANFPLASQLHKDESRWRVTATNGNLLGFVVRSSPGADNVAGYRGPTEALLLLEPDAQTVHSVLVGHSYDTDSYVKQVRTDKTFLPAFKGSSIKALAAAKGEKIQGVSGATQTSWAITEGIRRQLANDLRSQSRTLPWQPRARDWATWGVIIGAIIIAFTKIRGRRWVRFAWQAILIGYLGLVSGDLLSLALFGGWAANGVAAKAMPGLVAVAAAALVFPLTTRRQLYCHHLCPHGAAQHWLGAIGQKIFRRRARLEAGHSQRTLPGPPETSCHGSGGPRRVRSWVPALFQLVPVLLVALALFVLLSGYDLNLANLEAFDAWSWRAAAVISIGIAALGLVASLFIPQAYCRFGCPTGSILNFLRSTGSADHWGRRDWTALILLGGSVLLVAGTRLWPHSIPEIEPITFSGPAMGTTWSVKIRDELGDRAAVERAIAEQFEWAESMTSHWRPNTDLSEFNRTASTEPLPVPWPVVTLSRWSQEISRASDGAFDITVEPLVRLWGFGPGPPRTTPPTEAELEAMRAQIGWEKLEVMDGQLRKKHPGLEINLSAIAKGWAVDQVVQMLEQRGLTNFLVEAGGELSVRGRWMTGIEHPTRQCSLTNEALASSGTYRQKWIEGTNQFSHLLDPKTLRPISHHTVSVSVRHRESARADAWATALSVLGAERGHALAEKLGLAAQFVVEQPNRRLSVRSTSAWK